MLDVHKSPPPQVTEPLVLKSGKSGCRQRPKSNKALYQFFTMQSIQGGMQLTLTLQNLPVLIPILTSENFSINLQ